MTTPIIGRELEQTVTATFPHSQPIVQRALTRELLVLLGGNRPDRMELEKALLNCTEESRFLDELALASSDNGQSRVQDLPKSWRLVTKLNLKQMHSQSLTRVSPDLVDMPAMELIAEERRLTAGANEAMIRVPTLPPQPRDVEDDGEFHYVGLGPSAVSNL